MAVTQTQRTSNGKRRPNFLRRTTLTRRTRPAADMRGAFSLPVDRWSVSRARRGIPSRPEIPPVGGSCRECGTPAFRVVQSGRYWHCRRRSLSPAPRGFQGFMIVFSFVSPCHLHPVCHRGNLVGSKRRRNPPPPSSESSSRIESTGSPGYQRPAPIAWAGASSNHRFSR